MDLLEHFLLFLQNKQAKAIALELKISEVPENHMGVCSGRVFLSLRVGLV
ncbi:hypothetical protein ACQP3D_27465 [Escherichia coli]